MLDLLRFPYLLKFYFGKMCMGLGNGTEMEDSGQPEWEQTLRNFGLCQTSGHVKGSRNK